MFTYAAALSQAVPAATSQVGRRHMRTRLYHRFRWYATLENKTPAETFPKLSVNFMCYRHVGSKSTNHSPLAWRKEGQKVTLVAVIGGCRSDMSIARKIDANFWKRSRGCFVFQSRVSTKTVVIENNSRIILKMRNSVILIFLLIFST